jgi:hypothetical protein
MNVCRNLAGDVAAGRLSREQLDDLMDTLTVEKKRLLASDGLEGVEAGMLAKGRVIAEEAALAAMIEKRNRLQNVLVNGRLLDLAKAADTAIGDPAKGLQAAMVGINSPIEGAQRSVDALSQGMMSSYMGGMINDLKKAGVLIQYNNMKGDMELQVARALSDLNLPEPTGKVQASSDAKKIAGVMQKYQRAAMERENRAGAYIRNRSGYIVRQTHVPERMVRAGLDRWKASIRGLLDFERMEIPAEKIEGFLDSAYASISTGIRLDATINDLDRAFTGPGNLAKKASAGRLLEFKSSDDWMTYNRDFGAGNLRESFQQDLSRAARSTAIMTNFGTNPKAMLDRVTEQLKHEYRSQPDKLKSFAGRVENLKAQYAEISGEVNFGSSGTVAQVASSLRAVQTMAKLGAAWVSALSDVAFIATNRIYQGRSLMDSWGDALSAVTEGLQGGEKRAFADLMGAGLEGQLGSFMSRFDASDTVNGRTAKLMSSFFKLNLLGPWSDANKRGVTFMISRDLAMNAAHGFDDLPSQTKRLLSIYGIDARKWEVARGAVRDGPDGRSYLMPGDVDTVRGAAFSGLSEGQQQKLRDEVRDSLFALMVTEADFAVPSPGARERAILRRGYQPGTVAGEAIRFVGQFKSFGVTGLTKVMGRQTYGSGAKTLRDAMARGMGENLGLVNAIVGTTVLGFFVMQAKELMKGREPRPLNADTFVASMLQGGGLGIYGDFLFGEANRFGGGTLATVAGPGIGTIAEGFDLLQRGRGVVTGGDTDLRGDVLRLVKANVPFANLFYVKGAMDYLVWYQFQEMLNPGYLKRMERRVKRENNQGYILPPSSIVATGGGFR